MAQVEEKTLAARSIPELVSRSAFPLLIVFLGLALTTLMAVVQQDAAEREQQLMFEQVVARQQVLLADGIGNHLAELDETVGFVSAVFPSDVDEFRRFFSGTKLVSQLSNFDPGVFVIERVDRDQVAELEARERSLGNLDFTVQTLAPNPSDQLLVITRTSRAASSGSIDIEGLEISNFVSQVLGADLQTRGRTFFPVETKSVLASVFLGGEVPEEVVAVTNSIEDPTSGETVAWVTRLFEPTTLLTNLEEVDRRLNVEVSMSILNEPMTLGQTDEVILFDDAPLASSVSTESAGLEWTTKIWVGSEFGVATGLFDQVRTWIFGLLMTLAVLVGAVWRAVQDFRLSRANFELEHARTLASTDSLTGLLNRQGFIDRVRALSPSSNGTLFFVDLDGFKQVNDTREHGAGDTVLCEAAMLLSSQFRAGDIVGRFGGDEFAAFTPGITGEDHQAILSKRVIDSLKVLEDDVSCSVGTTTKLSNDHADVLELIRRADEAMYRAKQSGGGRYESSAST